MQAAGEMDYNSYSLSHKITENQIAIVNNDKNLSIGIKA